MSEPAPGAEEADVPAWARDLHGELDALRAEVARLRERMPPDGWEPGNLTCTAHPHACVAINSDTGQWHVWIVGKLEPAASGSTSRAAVAAWKAPK